MNRRNFLQLPLAGLPMLLFKNSLGQTRTKFDLSSSAKFTTPVIVSTWDSGMTANGAGWPVLQKGGRALDAVEAAGRASEDEPSCCVGIEALPDRDGHVTLDSCIMDGNGDIGAVSFLERIKHPVSVARKVMEMTPHVLLSGEGALQFAVANGFPLESGKLSEKSDEAWKEWLKKSKYRPEMNIENKRSMAAPYFFEDGTANHDTMGTVAIDSSGKLSGMVTTSGLAFKMRGRVGDSPIIGAGLFVDNEVGAATSSGVGEEVIRICGTHTVIEQMRFGKSPEEACREAIRRIVKRDPEKIKGTIVDGENTGMQIGFLAVSKTGEFGAFAVQKGFSYTVTNAQYPKGKIFESKSYFN